MYNICRLMLVVVVLAAAGLAALIFLAFMPLSFYGLLGLLAWKAIQKGQFLLFSHGTARWANETDLRRAGMLGKKGILLGRLAGGARRSVASSVFALFTRPAKEACAAFLEGFPGHRHSMVRINPVHVCVYAPVGVGKSTGIVIPGLLEDEDSTVVLDVKGELFTATAQRRAEMGHKIIALDPFKMTVNNPDSFNPIDWIDPKSPFAIDDCRSLAEAIVVRAGEGEKDPHWNDSAEIMLTAICAATVFFGENEDRSLQTVRSILADPAKLEYAISLLSQASNGILQRLGTQLTFYRDKELGSVLTSCNRHLRFLDSAAVYESTCKSTFNPAELKSGRMSIYLMVPPEHLRALSGLLRMWITSFLRACVRTP